MQTCILVVCVENYLVRVHACTYKVGIESSVASREQGAETRDQRAEGRGQRAEGREQRGAESREQRGDERIRLRQRGREGEEAELEALALVLEKERRPSLKPSLWCLRRKSLRFAPAFVRKDLQTTRVCPQLGDGCGVSKKLSAAALAVLV